MEKNVNVYIIDEKTTKYVEQIACAENARDVSLLDAFECWRKLNNETELEFMPWGDCYPFVTYAEMVREQIKIEIKKMPPFTECSEALDFHNTVWERFDKDCTSVKDCLLWFYADIDTVLYYLLNEYAPKRIDDWVQCYRFVPAEKLRIITQLEQRYKLEIAKGNAVDTDGGDVLQYCELMRKQLEDAITAAGSGEASAIPNEDLKSVFGSVWDEWHAINEQHAMNGDCGRQYNPFAYVTKDEFISAAMACDLGRYVNVKARNKTAVMLTVKIIYDRLNAINKDAAIRWANDTAMRVDDGKCFADGCQKKNRMSVKACKLFSGLFDK